MEQFLLSKVFYQEHQIEQDIYKFSSQIGSNVGTLIEKMREDPRDQLF